MGLGLYGASGKGGCGRDSPTGDISVSLSCSKGDPSREAVAAESGAKPMEQSGTKWNRKQTARDAIISHKFIWSNG